MVTLEQEAKQSTARGNGEAGLPCRPVTGKTEGTARALTVLMITALAFLVRVLNWPQVFVNGTIRFVGQDTLYHMRRIMLAVRHDLSIPRHDPCMNYPDGMICNWPPAFDQAVAALALLAGAGHPSAWLVQTVAALMPPVLGALTALLVFFIARCYLATSSALLAAGLFALMPYPVQVSVLGRADHHAAVLFLSCTLVLCVLHLTCRLWSRRTLYLSAAGGALLALCFATWVGSLLFAVILALFFALATISRAHRPRDMRRDAWSGALLFLSSAVVLTPWATVAAPGLSGITPWDRLSMFHVCFLLLCAAGLCFLALLLQAVSGHRAKKHRPRLLAEVCLLMGVASICLWLMHACGLLHLARGGGRWLSKADPLLRHLVESFPLNRKSAEQNFSRFIWLVPLLLPALAAATWRRRGRPEAALLLVVWTLCTGLAAARQQRFSDLLSLSVALLNAYALQVLAAGAGKATARCRTAWRKPVAVTVLAGVSLIVLWPTASWLRSYGRSAPRYSRAPVYDLCAWFRNHTAPIPGYGTGRAEPRYAVLADWSLGNALVYLAQRANVANNFVGWEQNRRANMAPLEFFVTDSPERAQSILERYGVRYIVVSDFLTTGYFARMLDILDLPHEAFFEAHPTPTGPCYTPTRRAMDSMAMQLYADNAAFLPAFEPVYSSSDAAGSAASQSPRFKVFRYAPPASP